MDARPDRAIRVVQNLGAGRSQNQAAVNSHALRRDHDEVGMMRRSAFDNLLRCFAMLDQLLDTKVLQPGAKEFIEILAADFMEIFERAVVGGLDHVQQDQLRVEPARERFEVTRGPPAAAGKIDGEKDSLELEHGSRVSTPRARPLPGADRRGSRTKYTAREG